MKKNSKFIHVFIAFCILSLPLIFAFLIFDKLPENIPTHFNLQGEPDQYGAKNSIFLGPIILGVVGLFTFLLITNIQLVDPKRYKNSDISIYGKLAYMLVIFLSALGFIIVQSSVNPEHTLIKKLFPLIGFLFIVLGYFMPSIKPNYFVGIRLPWTLESDENWIATHKMAAKWWIGGGILQVITGFLFPPEYAAISFFAILAFMIAIPAVFSFNKFKQNT